VPEPRSFEGAEPSGPGREGREVRRYVKDRPGLVWIRAQVPEGRILGSKSCGGDDPCHSGQIENEEIPQLARRLRIWIPAHGVVARYEERSVGMVSPGGGCVQRDCRGVHSIGRNANAEDRETSHPRKASRHRDSARHGIRLPRARPQAKYAPLLLARFLKEVSPRNRQSPQRG
jgi:hypothetical protein